MFDSCPLDALESGTLDFYDESDPDLLARWNATGEWWGRRVQSGIDPYQKVTTSRIGPETVGCYRDGTAFRGVNFASQDYLSLSNHPQITAAAKSAIDLLGVHSAGSAALMGNTSLSVELERLLCRFLGYPECTVFPIGWAAGYGVVKTLVRPTDHIIIDILAHACLQEAARDATLNVHHHPHLSTEGVERRLKRIRAKFEDCGILVITETLFSMDSDIPDIAALQELCRRYRATLLVDCAHDLGAIGSTGRGVLEEQNMVGAVDVLMGSFSKTFASLGGFVACQNKGLKFGLRGNCGPSTFTNAMSPVQAATVAAALNVVESAEGAERRGRLINNVHLLRGKLSDAGFEVLGRPSAIVPVVLGNAALSRLMTRYAIQAGAIVNLVEYPAVAKNANRWRLQVMADHTTDQIDQSVQVAILARHKAGAHVQWIAEREPGVSAAAARRSADEVAGSHEASLRR